jgi:hypothetical protein
MREFVSHSGWAKYAVPILISVASSFAVSCAAPEPAGTSAPSTTTSDEEQFESPAAPISRLASAGEHCFRTPLDVAAASARIAAYYEGAIRKYESARRVADAGGPLPPVEANTFGEVSDPDANNCILVSTYRYEDRYWWPPAR